VAIRASPLYRMSQLLKALKNLEARTPKPAAGAGLLAHLKEAPRAPSADPPPQREEPPSEPEPEPEQPQPAARAPSKPTPLARQALEGPLAHLAAGMPTVVFSRPEPEPEPAPEPMPEPEVPADIAPRANITERLPPSVTAPAPVEPAPVEEPPPPSAALQPSEEPADALPAPPTPESAIPPAPAGRQPTLIERTVRRTLADAERSEPFRQLADRLRTDMEKSGGRTVLITGVGQASETHEVILHVAAVLAERGQPILVIDADAARRSLSEQLELADRAGLAEAVHASRDPLLLVESTALDELSLLPFGAAAAGEPATSANRLSSVVQSLEARFRLVLIDGGRASDAGAATLARLSDATYFVVRLGETGAAAGQSAVSEFRAAGARVLGCIATS
jgi:Mrp family chromosome partitioning ATPase